MNRIDGCIWVYGSEVVIVSFSFSHSLPSVYYFGTAWPGVHNVWLATPASSMSHLFSHGTSLGPFLSWPFSACYQGTSLHLHHHLTSVALPLSWLRPLTMEPWNTSGRWDKKKLRGKKNGVYPVVTMTLWWLYWQDQKWALAVATASPTGNLQRQETLGKKNGTYVQAKWTESTRVFGCTEVRTENKCGDRNRKRKMRYGSGDLPYKGRSGK